MALNSRSRTQPARRDLGTVAQGTLTSGRTSKPARPPRISVADLGDDDEHEQTFWFLFLALIKFVSILCQLISRGAVNVHAQA